MRIYPPTPEKCARQQRPDKHSNVPEGLPTLLRDVIGSQKGLYCAALCGVSAICFILFIHRRVQYTCLQLSRNVCITVSVCV